jgi:hypothetical protein
LKAECPFWGGRGNQWDLARKAGKTAWFEQEVNEGLITPPGRVYTKIRSETELKWKKFSNGTSPAKLFRHRHVHELDLDFEEAHLTMVFPNRTAGSAIFLSHTVEEASADFALRVSSDRVMHYAAWDCPDQEIVDLPTEIKEGSGTIEWDFSEPARGKCSFTIVVSRQRADDVVNLHIRGELVGLVVTES